MKPTLTRDQLNQLEAARGVLCEPHGYDTFELASRLGVLEFHLENLIAVVSDLAGVS